MKVYERVASAFVAEGTRTTFGMMGEGNMFWMDALHKLDVQMLEVRHEGVAMGMADGWARATNTIGVCTTTCGPGVSQLATALLTASRAASPVVAFVGETALGDDESIHFLDQERFAAACETGFVRLASPDMADEAVRKAFYLARQESRPIMLSAPMDVQQKVFQHDDEPYRPTTTFARSGPVHPDNAGIQAAVDIIASSKRPVIVVGRGAVWSGAGDAVLKLGAQIGALLVTTLRAKNWLAGTPFHVGMSGNLASSTAMKFFREADCVIAVGASMNRFTTVKGQQYPNARFIHLDSKPHILMNAGRAADCYIQSDARAGVEALVGALAKQNVKLTGYRCSEVRNQLVDHMDDVKEFPIEPGCVDPRKICKALDEMVPPEIGVFIGSGSSAAFSAMLFNRPRSMVHAAYFFGCIGQMLPAAMGAVMATGKKPLVLVDGDASIIMHLSDFDTAVRYGMPLLVVVLNDQALGTEYHKLHANKLNAELAAVRTPDLGKIAKAFGGEGSLITSVEQLKQATQAWLSNPAPTILDCRISRNVLTLPNRRNLYGEDK